LVIYTVVTYSESLIFPSYNALSVCLGAAMVIFAGTSKYAGRLLTNKVMVFIGKISYSLYLVHWPIIVYYTHSKSTDAEAFHLSLIEQIILALACFVAAAFLYKFVEQPIRKSKIDPKNLTGARFGLICSLATLGICVVSASFWTKESGLQSMATKFIDDQEEVVVNDTIETPLTIGQIRDAFSIEAERDYTWKLIRSLDRPFGEMHKKILIIGDSQAADFMNLLQYHPKFDREKISTIPLNKFCQIKFSPRFFAKDDWKSRFKPKRGMRGNCLKRIKQVLEDERLIKADTIVLVQAWFPEAMKYMEKELASHKKPNNKKIIVIGRKDQPGASLNLFKGSISETERKAFSMPRQEVLDIDKHFPELIGNNTYFSLYDVFCHSGRCAHFTPTYEPIFYDARHISKAGAKYIGNSFEMLEIGDAIFAN